jgi:tight adherence protein B
MNSQLVLIVLAMTALPGAALLWALRHDRRRQAVHDRLKSVAVVVVPGRDEEPDSLLSFPQRSTQAIGGVVERLQGGLWSRLGPAFAATGNLLKLAHLFAAGFVAAALVMGFARGVLVLRPAYVLLLGFVAAGAAPALLLRHAQHRYQNRFLDGFPDALDLVGRAIRAGLPVNEALTTVAREMAGPVSAELQQALDQVKIGTDMIEALQQMADRVRVADFRFFVVALALQQKTGGGLAETLANLSTVIRARKLLRLKARALTSEAKASATVLAILPFVVGGLMCVLNKDLGRVLLYDPRGRFMIGVAFLMLLTGLGAMAAIVKRALR